jgi:hypothetical protein
MKTEKFVTAWEWKVWLKKYWIPNHSWPAECSRLSVDDPSDRLGALGVADAGSTARHSGAQIDGRDGPCPSGLTDRLREVAGGPADLRQVPAGPLWQGRVSR